MSAREELISALTNAWLCYGIGSRAEYEAEAARMIDAYAHELAEKIRQEIRSLKDHGALESDKDWAASDAADLIDPESADGAGT